VQGIPQSCFDLKEDPPNLPETEKNNSQDQDPEEGIYMFYTRRRPSKLTLDVINNNEDPNCFNQTYSGLIPKLKKNPLILVISD